MAVRLVPVTDYFRNGWILAALVTVVALFRLSIVHLVHDQPLTIGALLVRVTMVLLCVVFAFLGIRSVKAGRRPH
jgi:hypothetical protein